jgi:hypothetical protein
MELIWGRLTKKILCFPNFATFQRVLSKTLLFRRGLKHISRAETLASLHARLDSLFQKRLIIGPQKMNR